VRAIGPSRGTRILSLAKRAKRASVFPYAMTLLSRTRPALAAVLLSAISGCGRAAPPTERWPLLPVSKSASRAAPPRTSEECKSCDGIWGRGMSQVEFCNCRTHDAGKRCRDGAECEGMCIAADQPERDLAEAGPPPRGFFLGRCSELVTQFGCIRLIDRGAAARGAQPLNKPPPVVCVD
jgi:hypothetical protein